MKVVFVILFFILIYGCNNERNKSTDSVIGVEKDNDKARDIEKIKLTDLNGKEISMDQFKGKTVFINFWGTWCKPCIREMPWIETASNKISNENIIFLMASNESVEDIKAFSEDVGYKLTYARIVNSEEMNIEALPVTYIYDAKGKLAFSESGMRKWDDKNNLEMILKIANQK